MIKPHHRTHAQQVVGVRNDIRAAVLEHLAALEVEYIAVSPPRS